MAARVAGRSAPAISLALDCYHAIMDVTHERRDYASLASRVRPLADRSLTMQHVVDVLWDHLHPTGVSWLGFYLPENETQLVLGPRRDKPACSPIQLHGACGRAFLSRKPLLVRDVRELGQNYIACDPRDLSELVIPLLGQDEACWGVLDLDSYEVGAFDKTDIDGLNAVLRAAGLTA